MRTVAVIAAVVLVIGGINWGLVGLFDGDLVAGFLGQGSGLSRTVYSLVGSGAMYRALQWKAIKRRWAYVGAVV